MWFVIVALITGPCLAGWLIGDIIYCVLELRDARRAKSSLDCR